MLTGDRDATTKSWLHDFIREHGGVAGTVHVAAADDADLLHLVAAFNIPEKVQEITRQIPRGKGMAGLALQRGVPVQTCNLETDRSGDVRPGAKAVDARAAVALPVCDPAGSIRAVVGIAFADERELTDDELSALQRAADTLPS